MFCVVRQPATEFQFYVLEVLLWCAMVALETAEERETPLSPQLKDRRLATTQSSHAALQATKAPRYNAAAVGSLPLTTLTNAGKRRMIDMRASSSMATGRFGLRHYGRFKRFYIL